MKKLAYRTFLKAVEKTCVEYGINLDEWEKIQIASTLQDLNDIMSECARDKHKNIADRLFAICEKSPRGNLDTGRHYYSIHYIRDNRIHKVWLYGFTKVVGGYDQRRFPNLDRYIFSSGAIGMSRLLDATDGVFSYIKKRGGYYTQLHCL